MLRRTQRFQDWHAAGRALAVPVCAPDSAVALGDEADDVVCVLKPAGFGAVGAWYDRFDQTSDDEVLRLLHRSRV